MSTDPVLISTVERLLAELHPAEARHGAAEAGFAAAVWDALVGTGLSGIGVPETAGGSGGTLADAVAVASMLASAAVPVPFAETALVGAPLLAAAGLVVPGGAVSFPTRRPEGVTARDVAGGVALAGAIGRVPFAPVASVVVVPVDHDGVERLVAIDVAPEKLGAGSNLAGERRDAVVLDGMVVGSERLGAPGLCTWADLERRGALARAVQISGALSRVAELTIDYAWTRRQFGKPIATFQAVQSHLVRIASEAEAAAIAVQAAVLAAHHGDAAFEIAVAKAVASAAATEVAALAHQAHGAIGMTEEYELHHLTRRLWSWRQEFGSDRYWHRLLGRTIAAGGAARLWERVSAPVAPLRPAGVAGPR